MSEQDEAFKVALRGKNIPILPLDNKWYQLMYGLPKSDEMVANEEKVKELLKRQGKLNSDIKRLKKEKSRLMEEIVGGMEEEDSEEKRETNKRLIEEGNALLEQYQEELHSLPMEIEEYNELLMLDTMEVCYTILAENTSKIDEITSWINETRIELKKNIIRRQEKELKNQDMYHYMHDIFGPEVIDLFDLKYNPETEHVIKRE